MATNKLRDFLLTLANNPVRQDQFKKGGMDQMMKDAGLNAKEQEAVRSRDPNKIRKLVGPPHPQNPILCNAIYGGGPLGGQVGHQEQVVTIEL